jgi:hypothetical protein
VITPIKKSAERELLDWEKKFHTKINKIRYITIEQVIDNFKTWRIAHADYRRRISTFPHGYISHRPVLMGT